MGLKQLLYGCIIGYVSYDITTSTVWYVNYVGVSENEVPKELPFKKGKMMINQWIWGTLLSDKSMWWCSGGVGKGMSDFSVA